MGGFEPPKPPSRYATGFGRMWYVTFGLLSVTAESGISTYGRPLFISRFNMASLNKYLWHAECVSNERLETICSLCNDQMVRWCDVLLQPLLDIIIFAAKLTGTIGAQVRVSVLCEELEESV